MLTLLISHGTHTAGEEIDLPLRHYTQWESIAGDVASPYGLSEWWVRRHIPRSVELPESSTLLHSRQMIARLSQVILGLQRHKLGYEVRCQDPMRHDRYVLR